MIRSRLLLIGVVALATGYGVLAAPESQAAKVKVWNHSTPAHYDKAQLKQAVLSNEGAVRLSRQLKPLTGLDAGHVWAVAEDKAGNLYAATGPEGKLYKVTADGKVAVAYTSEDSQVLCLASAPDGSIYAGTGPGGQILHIDPQGTVKVLYASPEAYVWSLAVDPKGEAVYAGTGPKGKIYRLTPDGKASVFYSTRQEHILCLAVAADGQLYAGTDKGGLVYRIDAKGKGFVLFQAPQSEVRSLLVTAEAVYAGTGTPTRRRGLGVSNTGSSSSVAAPPTTSSVAPAATAPSPQSKGSEGPAATGAASAPAESAEAKKSTAAPAPAPPAAGENSLFRIAPDGSVREVFREKAMLLCLARLDGRLLVGTGMDGQLFEINEATRERSELARLDHGQILCLLRRPDGSVVLGTGDPGKLYVLQDHYAPRGSVVSDVLDAKLISKWGALRWRADTPAGTAVTVAVRSGNVAEPDDTWSDWSVEQTDAEQAVAAAPAARFVQYRVTLTSDNAARTPVLRRLTLRYQTTNQAPEVTAIEVPDLDAGNLDNPKKLKFKWTALDANEDELTYSLYIRKEGWKSWVLLEEGLEKREYEWDTTTAPAGIYHLKVVASDRKDNPDEDALSAERISAVFPVAHVPPAVTVKVVSMDGDHAVLEATVTDPLVRLVSASFAVNGKKWVNVFPTDGLFDSKVESFKFKTEALKPGTYVLVLRARDAAGNIGSGDVVFNVQVKGGQR
jgi:hypothetical protein